MIQKNNWNTKIYSKTNCKNYSKKVHRKTIQNVFEMSWSPAPLVQRELGDDFFRIFICLPLLRVLVDTLRMNIHERMKRWRGGAADGCFKLN